MRLVFLAVLCSALVDAATYISAATGNFTATGTWATIDGTSEVDVSNGTINISTANIDSPTFTPGAITVDGIALKISSRLTTGTFTATLRQNGVADVDAVTVNVTDLPNNGWVFFKFGSSHLLLGATLYHFRVVCSNTGNQVVLSRSTTGTNNMDKMLRTTSNPGALSANDKFVMVGNLTGAGTGNNITITQDNTATTSWCPVVSGGPPQGCTVNQRATLNWGTTNGVNYYLKVKGIFQISDGGIMNMGTSGTQMGTTATAVLEFDSAANVDSGLVVKNGGTFAAWGATKTNLATLLTADAAATATTITVGDTTGWAASDNLGFASTTRTYSQYETKVIQTVDSGTGVTLTAGLTNAHSGTSPTQGEVVNLTQNVKIRGISVTLQGYINVEATASFTARYTEIYQMGATTTGKRGIDTATTSGTFDVQYCSIHDFRVNNSMFINDTGVKSGTWSVDHTVFYRATHFLLAYTGSSIGNVFTNNVMMGTDNNSGSGAAIVMGNGSSGTFTGNTITSANDGCILYDNTAAPTAFSNNTIHSCASYGIRFVRSMNLATFSNLTIWRNTNAGIRFEGAFFNNQFNFDTITMFGNGTANMQIGGTEAFVDCTWSNLVLSGDSTFATTVGIQEAVSGITWMRHRIINSTFGIATGIKVAHSTSDFGNSANNNPREIIFENCNLASGTPIGAPTQFSSIGDYMAFEKWGQAAGTHRYYQLYGLVQTETGIVHGGALSQRMTPYSSSNKMYSAPWRVAVLNGGTVAASVWVYKSKSTDGSGCAANYSGNQPRLLVRANSALGIDSDTVLATYSASTGSWNQLSGTTAAVNDDGVLEFYVDADGTAGCVYVDNWLPRGAQDTSGLKFWFQGFPAPLGGGGASTSPAAAYVN